MLDAPQNYVQLWSATPISPWLLNLVFSSKSINNTLYLCWYDSCTRRYIYQHIFQPPVIKHTAALYWPMQLMLGYLMITISQWSYLIAVIISPQTHTRQHTYRHVLSWNIRYFLNVQVFFQKILGKLHWQITFSYLRHFRILNFRHFLYQVLIDSIIFLFEINK